MDCSNLGVVGGGVLHLSDPVECDLKGRREVVPLVRVPLHRDGPVPVGERHAGANQDRERDPVALTVRVSRKGGRAQVPLESEFCRDPDPFRVARAGGVVVAVYPRDHGIRIDRVVVIKQEVDLHVGVQRLGVRHLARGLVDEPTHLLHVGERVQLVLGRHQRPELVDVPDRLADLLVTVLGDDGDLANAPLDGAVVVGFVHDGAVGVAPDQRPVGVWVVHSVQNLGVCKVCTDGERYVAFLGVVDQNGTDRAGIVCVPGHARDFVTARRGVERDHAPLGRSARLHEKPIHGHVGDIGSYLRA